MFGITVLLLVVQGVSVYGLHRGGRVPRWPLLVSTMLWGCDSSRGDDGIDHIDRGKEYLEQLGERLAVF